MDPSVSVQQPVVFFRMCWTLRLCDVLLANELMGLPAFHPAVETSPSSLGHATMRRAMQGSDFPKNSEGSGMYLFTVKKHQEATTYSIHGSLGTVFLRAPEVWWVFSFDDWHLTQYPPQKNLFYTLQNDFVFLLEFKSPNFAPNRVMVWKPFSLRMDNYHPWN